MVLFIVSFIINKKDTHINFRNLFKKGIFIFLITFLIAGWWFIRSAVIYNGDFLGLQTTNEYGDKYAQEEYKPSKRKTPQRTGKTVSQMLLGERWIIVTAKSFIGIFGNMNIIMSNKIYAIYILTYLIGGIGTIIYFLQNIKKKIYAVNKRKLLLDITFLINIVIPICLSMYYSYTSDFQPQGRYVMPLLIPFMYFITIGIKTFIKTINDKYSFKYLPIQKIIFTCVNISFILLPIGAFIFYILPIYT